jgi:hypothetical protein
MTQLHSIDHGLGIVRPTNDVDIALHLETQRGVPNAVASAPESRMVGHPGPHPVRMIPAPLSQR